MTVPLILVLLTPLAGAVLAVAFGDVALQRRVITSVCAAVALGGAAWALVRTVSGSEVSWRGFTLDPWRALLVLGAVATTAAALARADHTSRPGLVQAAIFAAGVAGILPLLVMHAHLLAVTLPVSTAGVAVASLAAAGIPPRMLRSIRAVTMLVVSDVLALCALGVAIGKGAALPPRLSTTTAALLLAAAIIRLGVTPVAGPADDAGRSHPAMGLVWLGPVRAQGFLLAIFAVGSNRSVAYAGAAAAALTIVIAGTEASQRLDSRSLPALGTGVALLGFSLGGAVPTLGAALALCAAFAGPVAFAAGRGWSAGARATLAAVPAGGLIAGSALVLGASFGAGAIEPWFLALAIPAAVGLLAAVGSVWIGRDDSRTPSIVLAFAAPVGLAAALALVAVPDRAAGWLAAPVARTLGVGRLLSVGGEHGLAAGLAIVVLGAAFLALIAGPGRLGTGGPPGWSSHTRSPLPLHWGARAARAPGARSGLAAERAAGDARRWAIAASVLFVIAIALAAQVYIAAAGRGFL